MNKEEQEIIESTKEFAKAHNIHYDQMTENMILNAMREQLLLHNVVKQSELLTCDNCKYTAIYEGYEISYLECMRCGKTKAY